MAPHEQRHGRQACFINRSQCGTGFATAVSLLEAGATLTVVIRDPAKLDLMQRGLRGRDGSPG